MYQRLFALTVGLVCVFQGSLYAQEGSDPVNLVLDIDALYKKVESLETVSYTHLTLPTILRV